MITGSAIIIITTVTGFISAFIMQLAKSEKEQIYKWLNWATILALGLLVIASTILSLSPWFLAVAFLAGLLIGIVVPSRLNHITELIGIGVLLGASLMAQSASLSILVSIMTTIVIALILSIKSADTISQKGSSWMRMALVSVGLFFISAMSVYSLLYFTHFNSPNCMLLLIIGFVSVSIYLRLKEMIPKKKAKQKKK